MSVQKYRVFQSRLISIDDDSMFNRDCHSVVVTHADYRALEDENRSLRASFDEAHELWIKSTKELASIKARVGELVEADVSLDTLIRTSSHVAKDQYAHAIGRRDKALEDLK